MSMVRVLCIGFAIALFFTSAMAMSQTMKPEDVRTIIERSRDAWANKDADAVASFFGDDGELIVPGNRWVGREAIRQAAIDFFAADFQLRIDIKQIIVEGDRAAVEWYWEERDKATGQVNKADDAIVVEFKDGAIVRWREYIDTATWGGKQGEQGEQGEQGR